MSTEDFGHPPALRGNTRDLPVGQRGRLWRLRYCRSHFNEYLHFRHTDQLRR